MLLNNVAIHTTNIPYYYCKSIEELSKEIIQEIDCKKYIIVFDESLPRKDIDLLSSHLGEHSSVKIVGISVSEAAKNIFVFNKLVEVLIENNITRDTYIIAIGGGILGNIVGLVSGLLYRGINFIHVPTTFIACADSVLSIKQAVNSSCAKNIIGTYYAPVAIFTCYSLFKTLPLEHISAGYVEYVKNMMIIVPEIITPFLSSNLNLSKLSYNQVLTFIDNSINAKNILLKNDPHERNEAIIFEYGHTIGHAIEIISDGQINHGEGVAFGMLVSTLISNKLGFMQKEHVDTLVMLLNKIGIIDFLKQKAYLINQISNNELLKTLSYDNKRGYILTKSNEIAMVILKNYAEVLMTNDKCLIPVNKDIVIYSYIDAQNILGRVMKINI